jgi:hypothetical protein
LIAIPAGVVPKAVVAMEPPPVMLACMSVPIGFSPNDLL